MPEMDGFEALRIIRQMETYHGIAEENAARIIMITAKDQPESIAGAFRIGCEAYIVKPLTREKLDEEIRERCPKTTEDILTDSSTFGLTLVSEQGKQCQDSQGE